MAASEVRQASARTKGFNAFSVVVGLVALMWGLELIDQVLPADLDQYGIESRTASGLPGIWLSPLLHADFAHLLSNTVPFVLLGLLVAWRSGQRFLAVVVTIVTVGGLGVWLFGASNVLTIGASGVVFGFLAYLLVAGFFTQHIVDILVAAGVLMIYGGLLFAATPFGVSAGISWLAHIMGAFGGVLAAMWFAPRRAPEQTVSAS